MKYVFFRISKTLPKCNENLIYSIFDGNSGNFFFAGIE